MIVHVPPYGSSALEEIVRSPGVILTAYPNREQSRNGLSNRLQFGAARTVVDFEWHSPSDSEKPWVAAAFGARSDLRSSTSDRREMFADIATLTDDEAVLAPGGRPDQLSDSCRYAKELWEESGQSTWATIAISRQSLVDPSVLMQVNQLHVGVDGFYLVVVDNAGFPSNWAANELESYLGLTAAQALSGRTVLAAHADVRGLMAVALGASHLGTGLAKAMRQYGAPTGGGAGVSGEPAPPTKSYLSLPLLGVLHSDRAQAILSESELRSVESHSECVQGVRLDLQEVTSVFAEDWMRSDGNPNIRRALSSVLSLNAAEAAIMAGDETGADFERNLTRRADFLANWLESAASLAGSLDQSVFQTPGARSEICVRPAAFAAVRQSVGI